MFKSKYDKEPKNRSIWAYFVIGLTALVGADVILDDRTFDIQN